MLPLTENKHVLDTMMEMSVTEDGAPKLELVISTDLDPSDYKDPSWKELLNAVQQYLKTFGAAHLVRFKRVRT